MEKIKVSAVSYLNTKPFLYGLEHSSILDQIELSQDIPSIVSEKLIAGKASIGLLPTASIPEIQNAQIIGDYCIGSDGEVGSVCIYSRVPIEEATHVYLDYQSRTSVELTKVLLKQYWKVTPQLLPSFLGYEKKINDTYAGLIIGDRALLLKKDYKFCYDLGAAWKEYTTLPFVFACWVSDRELSTEFIYSFNEALKNGVQHVAEVAKQNQFFYPGIDTFDYLAHKIQYPFGDRMKEGMETFLGQLKGMARLETT